MAFARTWAEELIAEWMQQEGYLVDTGVPVPIPKAKRATKRSGGRREVDVVGVRLAKSGLEILHVETGAVLDQQTVKRIGQKFSAPVRRYIMNRFKNRLGGRRNHVEDYKMRCVVTYPHKRGAASWGGWIAAIHKLDPRIKVDRLEDFIAKDVTGVLPKDGDPMLPEGQWLLCLVAYLRDYSVCNFGNLTGPEAQAA